MSLKRSSKVDLTDTLGTRNTPAIRAHRLHSRRTEKVHGKRDAYSYEVSQSRRANASFCLEFSQESHLRYIRNG